MIDVKIWMKVLKAGILVIATILQKKGLLRKVGYILLAVYICFEVFHLGLSAIYLAKFIYG